MNRTERLKRMRKLGLTYEEIGEIEGITKQRVAQLLKRPRHFRHDKTMLTAGAAAAMIGVHPNTIRRWANLGKIKCYRIGGRKDRRFNKKDIKRLLNEN